MNREIKFRAWSKNLNKMYKVGQVTLEKGGWNYSPDDREYKGVCVPSQPNLVLMQFTGLYDKNKVPIYEGDILKFINNRSEDEDVSKSKVYTFEGVPFCIDIETGEYDVQTLAWAIKGDISECEVIGNIYDNPDLLGE